MNEPTAKDFPDVTTMTPWDLAQAIAINSDEATYLWNKSGDTDEETDANREKARVYYDRRNACVAEIRDRQLAVPAGGAAGAGLRETVAEAALHALDTFFYGQSFRDDAEYRAAKGRAVADAVLAAIPAGGLGELLARADREVLASVRRLLDWEQGVTAADATRVRSWLARAEGRS